MKNIMLFNDNWSFLKTELGSELSGIKGQEGKFQPVDLPHDWLIYNTHNLYENSTGWYRKCITVCLISDEARKETEPGNDADTLCLMPGERAILRFDGVYMDSTFYVNRQKVGDWKYGYSAFDYDITEYLQPGENELLMQVRYQSPNSRWYSGAGIYRNVWLKVCPIAYLPLDGTYVHTAWQQDSSGQNGSYQLEIETECAGAIGEDTRCHYSLWQQEEQVRDLGWGELFTRADGQLCFALKIL
ncbi:MAG: hypothetical protein K2K19_02765, partial [Acetatifactor sp.]|nr:hypothetical protein [Acetatifactor sp.]